MNVLYDMGEMCAHKVYESGDFAILTCSKLFSDTSSRKIQIYNLADGVLVGQVSINGAYKTAITDTLAYRTTSNGI